VVEHRIHRGICEQVIPGVLKSYDLPHLVASLAPRPVWLVNAADPLGLPLTLERAAGEYAPALEAFRKAGAADSLRVLRRGEGSFSDFYQDLLK